jgi:predicted lipoprotein with Yx(FWY)xxD motif
MPHQDRPGPAAAGSCPTICQTRQENLMLKAAAIATALTIAALAALAASNPAPAAPANGVLATPAGATLYTFDKDTANSGKSACNGPCAANWPPFAAQASDAPSGEFSIVTRDDGSRQWAYKGWPLYTFAKDAKPGDTAGEGKGNVWHLIKG